MSERTLRGNLFVVTMVTFFLLPGMGMVPNSVIAFFYIGEALGAVYRDSLYFAYPFSMANFLWFTLYLLSVPILGVLQLCVLAKPGWKRFSRLIYRTILLLLFVVVWWGTLVRLSYMAYEESIWAILTAVEFWACIGFWASPLVVTVAGGVEIILIKREAGEPSEGSG